MSSKLIAVRKISSGDAAWIALAVYVMGYDLYAWLTGRDTLSQSFDRALQHPLRGSATLCVWAGLTVHLFDKAFRREINNAKRLVENDT